MQQPVRLNKFLALQLSISRRQADDLISSGKVIVNGLPAILGARINNPTDTVVVNGQQLSLKPTNLKYVAFNKPLGYVCSKRAQGSNPTIYSILPAKYQHLNPVGRLDCNSSGILLLTNDGDFAYKMTHPKFYKNKIYEVRLNKELEPLHQQMISDYGIQLDDGPSKLLLERLSDDNRLAWRVIMSEGRNRQIRRTFLSLGYIVTALHRTNFGDYSLGDIPPGKTKVLDMR